MYTFDCTNLFTFRDQSKELLREIRRNCLGTEPGSLNDRKYYFRNIVVGVWVAQSGVKLCFRLTRD